MSPVQNTPDLTESFMRPVRAFIPAPQHIIFAVPAPGLFMPAPMKNALYLYGTVCALCLGTAGTNLFTALHGSHSSDVTGVIFKGLDN